MFNTARGKAEWDFVISCFSLKLCPHWFSVPPIVWFPSLQCLFPVPCPLTCTSSPRFCVWIQSSSSLLSLSDRSVSSCVFHLRLFSQRPPVFLPIICLLLSVPGFMSPLGSCGFLFSLLCCYFVICFCWILGFLAQILPVSHVFPRFGSHLSLERQTYRVPTPTDHWNTRGIHQRSVDNPLIP